VRCKNHAGIAVVARYLASLQPMQTIGSVKSRLQYCPACTNAGADLYSWFLRRSFLLVGRESEPDWHLRARRDHRMKIANGLPQLRDPYHFDCPHPVFPSLP
jgi:hypothetical protein